MAPWLTFWSYGCRGSNPSEWLARAIQVRIGPGGLETPNARKGHKNKADKQLINVFFFTWLLYDVWYVTNIRNHEHNKKFYDCNSKTHTNRVSLCWGQLRPWLSSSEWIRRDLDREMRWLERMECLAPRWSHWKILEAASQRKSVGYPPVIQDGGEFDIYRWFSLIFIDFPVKTSISLEFPTLDDTRGWPQATGHFGGCDVVSCSSLSDTWGTWLGAVRFNSTMRLECADGRLDQVWLIELGEINWGGVIVQRVRDWRNYSALTKLVDLHHSLFGMFLHPVSKRGNALSYPLPPWSWHPCHVGLLLSCRYEVSMSKELRNLYCNMDIIDCLDRQVKLRHIEGLPEPLLLWWTCGLYK